MEPIFFRYGLQVKRTRGASLTAGTTADAQVPVINRLLIGGLIKGMCVKLATPDALPAGIAFVIILDDPVVRSLDRFQWAGQTCCIQEGAATTAAVTGADELRSLRSHGEPLEPRVNHGSHTFEFIPERGRFLPGEHVFR